MNNQVQLITYVDRFGGGGIDDLHQLLGGSLRGVVGGIHLLPFFYPIDGADAGFDPIDHLQVDPRLGDWETLRQLAGTMPVMADVIVNHMSADSPQFIDYSARGANSPHDGLFLTLDRVFPEGAREADLLQIYRPRPGLPLTPMMLRNGERRILWTTFTPKQIDIDVEHPQGQAYLQAILQQLADSGVTMVRLDAVGYAIKRAGSSSFMTPETFEFIGRFAGQAKALGLEVLVEVHSYFQRQIEIARQVDWVYDFALPPLLLHALSFGTADGLARWIDCRPHNAITVLDTHDGIGIIDIGADSTDRKAYPGLVPDHELDELVERIHVASQGKSRQATGAAASNLDLYQVNCTYYDALGRNDRAYLLARAIQFFLPGVPQVYYVGLLAGSNDMELLARTGVGRDINRHHYTPAEIEQALERPVVRDLFELIRLRNRHPAFGGDFRWSRHGQAGLELVWSHGSDRVSLHADLARGDFAILTEGADSNGTMSFLTPTGFP